MQRNSITIFEPHQEFNYRIELRDSPPPKSEFYAFDEKDKNKKYRKNTGWSLGSDKK